ncbi:hypothetical protein ACFYE9_17345 [Rhizobium leguminosarum]|uniref:Uncharacterized protein n=2 Tax=Rhizobium leguminosarum TaxID=384 RepID=A0A154IA46_RHILE|nr:hypothetical protein [Rhizobium leguminosarum]KZA97473.1 hypothetical protein A4A59_04795 [Rhizobium leguminosarum]
MPAALAEINRVEASIKVALGDVAKINATPAFRLDEKLKADPALLEEFKKDPMGMAAREGFVIPPGFHIHFINENNEYFPPEGDAISQLQRGKTLPVWGRVEIRFAVGPGCIAACGICW